MKIKSVLVALCLLIAGCSTTPTQSSEVIVPEILPTSSPQPTMASLPNPASVYCEQQGNRSEIRTAADGSQSGVCIFPDGSECDEWAYYRGECAPASQADPTRVPGEAFCEMLGYTLASQPAPDGSTKTVCLFDDGSTCDPTALLKGECVPLSQIMAMPNPAAAYCKQQGYQSEISTAADGSQNAICIFPDGSQCDDWAYLRGECTVGGIAASTDPSSGAAPTPIPTAVPIDPSFYQGFWTYTDPQYGFSIQLPEDWIVDQTTTSDPLMNGHMLVLRQESMPDAYPSLRMTYRNVGEDTLLWPTGVGQGEFVSQGTLDVAGQPAERIYLVCPNGLIDSIWYQGGEGQPNIQRGNMEFAFIYSYAGANCQEPYSLTGKLQLTGEQVIASLQVP